MAHQRDRILFNSLKKALGWSPIVGVTGARQVGKTTLLKKFSREYLTFDHPGVFEKIEKSSTYLLDRAEKPFFLDEVQKYPPVFDLLKICVDQNKRPGQFLITGSIRFSSKKEIRESLTGRVQIYELLPLTLSESHEEKYTDLIELFDRKKTPNSIFEALQSGLWSTDKQVIHYTFVGGLPGICFLRDEEQRVVAVEQYLDTLLNRDLMSFRKHSLTQLQLLKILSDLSSLQGMQVNFSELARRHSLSPPTVKNLIIAFEALYLLRRHGDTVFFEDFAISRYVSRLKELDDFSILHQWVFSVLNAQRLYCRQHQSSLDQYFTRGGARVPFVLASKKAVIGFTLDNMDGMSEKSIKSLYSFKKKYRNAYLLNIHRGTKGLLYKKEIISIPWTWLA